MVPKTKGVVLFLKNLLFTVIVPGSVAFYVPLLMVCDQPRGSAIGLVVSCALLVAGGIIYIWCVWDFATFGRGTPAPIDAPKQLVVRGLYRYTRNPMYLGILTVILGWAIFFNSFNLVFYAVCVGGCLHLFVVFYEEPHLQKTFGHTYDQYHAEVRRWLPRFGVAGPYT